MTLEPAIDYRRFLSESEPCTVPAAARTRIAGSTVLITGAGGYIGSALAQAALRADAGRLLLLDHAEAGLYETGSTLAGAADTPVRLLLGNAGDSSLLQDLFRRHKPDIVFHAAAYKHVPLAEANSFAVVENNVLAAAALAQICAQEPATELIMVSTDKAVAPRSIMGASKRLGELLVMTRPPHRMQRAVRLGNVMGSPGSVGPLFARQIAEGGTVTVTDPLATRYLISLEQAVAYLLCALAAPPEATLLVPPLHAPVRIVELAQAMIADRGNPIAFTGLRPGEKLEEALVAPAEITTGPAGGHLRSVHSPHSPSEVLNEFVRELLQAARARDLGGMLAALRAAVPDYLPGANLLRDAGQGERA